LDVSSEGLATCSEDLTTCSEDLDISSEGSATCSEDLDVSSEGSTTCSEYLDSLGRLQTSSLPAPIIHDLTRLSPSLLNRLKQVATLPNSTKRLSKDVMKAVILELCKDHFITRSCLAELVARNPDSLRQQYLREMLTEGVLKQAFPQSPTDSRQAYINSAYFSKQEDRQEVCSE